MNRITVISMIGFIGLFFSVNAQIERSSPKSDKNMAAWMLETNQIAKEYVECLDQGLYAESWTKGDPLFQKTIKQQEWIVALKDNHKDLGKMNNRTLIRQCPCLDPQGLPKGPYAVVQYQTDFEYAHGLNELLTLRRGIDGKWRILTYRIN